MPRRAATPPMSGGWHRRRSARRALRSIDELVRPFPQVVHLGHAVDEDVHRPSTWLARSRTRRDRGPLLEVSCEHARHERNVGLDLVGMHLGCDQRRHDRRTARTTATEFRRQRPGLVLTSVAGSAVPGIAVSVPPEGQSAVLAGFERVWTPCEFGTCCSLVGIQQFEGMTGRSEFIEL